MTVRDGRYWWRQGPHSNLTVLLQMIRHGGRDCPENGVFLAVPAARHRGPDQPSIAKGLFTDNDHDELVRWINVHPTRSDAEEVLVGHQPSSEQTRLRWS
jgi:hypothetical protein